MPVTRRSQGPLIRGPACLVCLDCSCRGRARDLIRLNPRTDPGSGQSTRTAGIAVARNEPQVGQRYVNGVGQFGTRSAKKRERTRTFVNVQDTETKHVTEKVQRFQWPIN